MDEREQQRKVWHRVLMLRHAEEVSGNVAATCRYYGISRQAFYKWQRRYDELGEEGLRDNSTGPHHSPTATDPEIIQTVIYLRRSYHFGPEKISMYLKRYHEVPISPSGVWRILKRLDLNRLPASKRHKRHDRRWKRYEKPLPARQVPLPTQPRTAQPHAQRSSGGGPPVYLETPHRIEAILSCRHLIAALLVAPLVLFAAPAAMAAPPATDTVHEKNLVENFTDVLPSCNGGPDYNITTTSNLVSHVTAFTDGRTHETFTQTGTFVAVPVNPALPTYTGHFTVWGGFNANGKTVDGTFTFNVTGVGSDGSRLSNHVVQHFNVRPDGTVHEFFHCH